MGTFSKLADLLDPPKKWDSPLDLAEDLDPSVLRVLALSEINKALVWAHNEPDSRLIISMPPQQGKSQLAVRRFVTWSLAQDDSRNIVVASYEHNVARRWGRLVRDDIQHHSERLGMTVRADVSAQHEWQIDNGKDTGGLYTTGVGGALTSRQAHLMIIDDPVKDSAAAQSKKQRETTWDWWDTVAQTRLAPGAAVIVIMTRWHQDDLAGRLIDRDPRTWRVLNISAQADHRPERGDEDILGRDPGEFMQSVQVKAAKGRVDNEEWWSKRKASTSPKTWASMYMGKPSPEEGGVFPRTDDWERYSTPLWDVRPDGTCHIPGAHRDDVEILQSWDLAFKGSDTSDFVVGQVWMKEGMKAYLVDQVRERMNFDETVRAIKRMAKKWPQARGKLVEDKANGPAVINHLGRTLPGLIPIEPEGSKYARASAISPYAFSGDIILPDTSTESLGIPHELKEQTRYLLNEAMDFPDSANDDTIDAMSQAVNRLLGMPLEEEMLEEPDDQELIEERGFLYSPF